LPAPAELRCEAPLSAPLVPLYLSDGNRGCLNPFHGNPRGRRRPSGFAVDSPQEGGVTCELVSGNPDFNVRKKENGRPKAKFDQYLDLV